MLKVFLLFSCLISHVTLPFEYKDFDDEYSYYYNYEAMQSTPLITELTRMRRHQEVTQTTSSDDLQKIQSAVKQILLGRKIDDWDSETSSKEFDFKLNGRNNKSHDTSITTFMTEYDRFTPITRYNYGNLTLKPSGFERTSQKHDNSTMKFKRDYVTSMKKSYDILSTTDYDSLTTITPTQEYDVMTPNTESWTRIIPERSTKKPFYADNNDTLNSQEKKELLSYLDSMAGTDRRFEDTTEDYSKPTRIRPVWSNTIKPGSNETELPEALRGGITTTSTPKTTVLFNIDVFLEIVSNLTYDYYTNLTEQVNATLIKMKVPTCGTPTTTTVEPTTEPEIDYRLQKENVMAKCFVCGLEEPAIPFKAHCADAFAGDFIPLVPQDPSAKRNVARYRKYCRYMDINNYMVNETMPRSVFGRWTGGCSVRWTDLTGVYTQRSCRNRRQAATGSHYASKRMARLEMALSNVNNGCIISPVASLLPLSRGISLFARFHACVCTGNWCNRSSRFNSDVWMTAVIAVTAVIVQSCVIS